MKPEPALRDEYLRWKVEQDAVLELKREFFILNHVRQQMEKHWGKLISPPRNDQERVQLQAQQQVQQQEQLQVEYDAIIAHEKLRQLCIE